LVDLLTRRAERSIDPMETKKTPAATTTTLVVVAMLVLQAVLAAAAQDGDPLCNIPAYLTMCRAATMWDPDRLRRNECCWSFERWRSEGCVCRLYAQLEAQGYRPLPLPCPQRHPCASRAPATPLPPLVDPRSRSFFHRIDTS
jgi:hypothetical protein